MKDEQIKRFKRAVKGLPARSPGQVYGEDEIPVIEWEGNSIEIDGPDREQIARRIFSILGGAEALVERLEELEKFVDPTA